VETLKDQVKPFSYYRQVSGRVLRGDGLKTDAVMGIKKRCRLFKEGEREFFEMISSLLWRRDPNDWTPKGRSVLAQRDSLISHLFVLFPVPKFLYALFCSGTSRERKLFLDVAQGRSLYKGVRKGSYLIKTLTRKMCYYFLQQPPGTSLPLAIRASQVKVYGGQKSLAKALCQRPFGKELGEGEEFKAEVIQWICNQGMMEPSAVSSLIDLLQHLREQNPEFSMKGRTYSAIQRRMEEWHEELRVVKVSQGEFDPSGFSGFSYEKEEGIIWTIHEILSGVELSKEGSTMRHCVYSYSNRIKKGEISIWSLRLMGARKATIEVNNKSRQLLQARGKANCAVTKEDQNVIARWARENGLTLSYYNR